MNGMEETGRQLRAEAGDTQGFSPQCPWWSLRQAAEDPANFIMLYILGAISCPHPLCNCPH